MDSNDLDEESGEEFNHLPAHQGFVSAEERDWVMRTARDCSGDRDPSFATIFHWLVAFRAGTEVPLPSYKMLRNSWDLTRVIPT